MTALQRLLVSMLTMLLTYLCTRMGLSVDQADIAKAAGELTLYIGTGAFVLWDILSHTDWYKRWRNRSTNVTPLILIAAMGLALGLGGCSNLTPNQRLHAGEVGYVAADLALTGADAAGKVPVAVKPQIQADMIALSQRLEDAQTWVDANPNLANTPGISPPSLDALDIARAVVRKYVLKYTLFAPLPAFRQPAATQPQ